MYVFIYILSICVCKTHNKSLKLCRILWCRKLKLPLPPGGDLNRRGVVYTSFMILLPLIEQGCSTPVVILIR